MIHLDANQSNSTNHVYEILVTRSVCRKKHSKEFGSNVDTNAFIRRGTRRRLIFVFKICHRQSMSGLYGESRLAW